MDYVSLARELLELFSRLKPSDPPRMLTQFSQGELFVLKYLNDSSDPVTPGQLSRTEGISTARIAAVLRGLESKGLITRLPCPTDLRSVIVVLTPAGRNRIQEERLRLEAITVRMLQVISEDDALAFVRTFRTLVEYREKHGRFFCVEPNEKTGENSYV